MLLLLFCGTGTASPQPVQRGHHAVRLGPPPLPPLDLRIEDDEALVLGIV